MRIDRGARLASALSRTALSGRGDGAWVGRPDRTSTSASCRADRLTGLRTRASTARSSRPAGSPSRSIPTTAAPADDSDAASPAAAPPRPVHETRARSGAGVSELSAAPTSLTSVTVIPHSSARSRRRDRSVSFGSTISTVRPRRGWVLSRPASDGSSAPGASIVNPNVEPAPTSLSTPISPPSIRTIRLLMASPSPVPPYRRLMDASACPNDSKRRSTASGEMPIPVSDTSKRSRSAPASPAKTARQTSPRSVNLTAFAEQVDEHLAQARRVADDDGGHCRRRPGRPGRGPCAIRRAR